jgi:hypothetical protein
MRLLTNVSNENLIFMQMAISNNNAQDIIKIEQKAYWGCGTLDKTAVAVYDVTGEYPFKVAIDNTIHDYIKLRG